MLPAGLQTALVDLFIAALLVLFWCWDGPPEKLPRRLLRRGEWLVNWTGLWHGWGMFAPAPIRVNRRLRVELELADGTRGDWPLVHLGDLGPLRAVWWGRHRKLQESLLLRKPTILRASFCDHVARRWVDAHPAGPDPVAIRLYCATAAVRPPGSADPFGTPGPETLVYTHRVQVVVRAQACAPDDPGAPAAVGMLVAAR